MKKRYHCEYKECKCNKFVRHHKSLCYICHHAKLWHSKKSKPPTDGYLSFLSSRLSARTPKYTNNIVSSIQIAVFIPEAPAIPVADSELIFCENIESLPI
jgi:hypothetical protein